jgi:hypothetical protein
MKDQLFVKKYITKGKKVKKPLFCLDFNVGYNFDPHPGHFIS